MPGIENGPVCWLPKPAYGLPGTFFGSTHTESWFPRQMGASKYPGVGPPLLALFVQASRATPDASFSLGFAVSVSLPGPKVYLTLKYLSRSAGGISFPLASRMRV